MMYRYKEKFALRFDDDELMKEWIDEEENIFQWVEEESSLGMLKRGIKAVIQYAPRYAVEYLTEECFDRLYNKLEKEEMQELLIEILRYAQEHRKKGLFEMLAEKYSDDLDPKLVEEIKKPVKEKNPKDILFEKYKKQKGVAKYLAKLVNAETDCRFEESKLREILYPIVNRCYRMNDAENHSFKDEIVRSLLMTKGSPAYQGYFDYVKNFIETNENSLERLDNFGIIALPERRSVEQQLKDFVADVKEHGYDPKRGMECLMILQKLSRMHISIYEELIKNADVMEFLFTHFPKEYRIRYQLLFAYTDRNRYPSACKPWMELSLHMLGKEWEEYNEQLLLYMLEKPNKALAYYCYENLNLTERQKKLMEGYCFEIGEERMAVEESYEWKLMDQFDAYIHEKGDWIQQKRLRYTYQTCITWLWENKRHTLMESMLVKLFREKKLSFCTDFLKNWMRILKPEERKGILKEFPYMWARWLSQPELPTSDILSMGRTIGTSSRWDVFEAYYKMVYETCGYVRLLELCYPEKRKLPPQLMVDSDIIRIEFLYVGYDDSIYDENWEFYFLITKKTDKLSEFNVSIERINDNRVYDSSMGEYCENNERVEHFVSCYKPYTDDNLNIIIPETMEFHVEIQMKKPYDYFESGEIANLLLYFDMETGRYYVKNVIKRTQEAAIMWTNTEIKDIQEDVTHRLWKWDRFTPEEIQNADLAYQDVPMYKNNGIEMEFIGCTFEEEQIALNFWVDNQSDQKVQLVGVNIYVNGYDAVANDGEAKFVAVDPGSVVKFYANFSFHFYNNDGDTIFGKVSDLQLAICFKDEDGNVIDTTGNLKIQCNLSSKSQIGYML